MAKKFEAAWEVFTNSCAVASGPEATFQARLAHYVISQFGIDRVMQQIQNVSWGQLEALGATQKRPPEPPPWDDDQF